MLGPWHGVFIDFHRQVEEVFEEMVFRRWGPSQQPEWAPSVDIHETREEFLLLVDIPGVSPDQVCLSVVGRSLTITGEKRDSLPTEPLYSRRERSTGRFHRVVELPFTFDAAKAVVEERHGTYCVRIPKKAVHHEPQSEVVAHGPKTLRVESV